MAALESAMMPLGTNAPDFSLTDVVSKETVTLSKQKSDVANVVMFICNHCPYVVHVQDQLAALGHDYQPQGVKFFAICANDADRYPDDAPAKMKVMAEELGYPFPYLHDESQDVARAYDAQCTPDIYVFDGDLKCTYRGQLDDARPGNDVPVTGHDVRAALDAMLAGQPVNIDQKPSIGCSIKWR